MFMGGSGRAWVIDKGTQKDGRGTTHVPKEKDRHGTMYAPEANDKCGTMYAPKDEDRRL